MFNQACYGEKGLVKYRLNLLKYVTKATNEFLKLRTINMQKVFPQLNCHWPTYVSYRVYAQK